MNNKYAIGKIVTGKVTGIEKYGIFVNLDDYYSGLVHISEISDSFVRNIDDYVNIGEYIRVKILDIDNKNFHLKLSIKNINYHINRQNKNKIKETRKGFSTLEKMLDMWVEKKYSEILSKAENKM